VDGKGIGTGYLSWTETILPVSQYVCYISSFNMDAIELHELYKQRSTSETWIEQVKGHVMAGETLTLANYVPLAQKIQFEYLSLTLYLYFLWITR